MSQPRSIWTKLGSAAVVLSHSGRQQPQYQTTMFLGRSDFPSAVENADVVNHFPPRTLLRTQEIGSYSGWN